MAFDCWAFYKIYKIKNRPKKKKTIEFEFIPDDDFEDESFLFM